MLEVSDVLGYTSIACWLGAQFPQVVENLRRQSCEGLALPFLANWLMGDVSNLIGCILTHQLPFQRWLATYFVFVDLLLVTQYAYYYKTPKRSLSALNRIRSASSPGRMDRSASRYRTISAVASNVAAAAAAAAAQQDGHRPPSVRYSQQSDQHHLHERSSSGVSERLVDGDPGYSDEGNSPMLADSYHSDGGREASRKRVSWSIERHRDRAASVGRTPTALHIPTDLLSDFNAQSHEHALNEPVSPAVSNRGSRASRRGSTMVFLGAWALFGIGTLTSGRTGMSMSTTDTGRVLVSGHNLESSTPFYYSHPDTFLSNPSVNQLDTLDLDSAYPRDDSYDKSSPPEQPSSTQVLGRIFAWLCTTLYLTSRLPQIWKNYVRKSVEGLSMYLFVFAFLGNVFYVASILSSPRNFLPPPQAAQFIRESIPYLLGSGGTLMFDITIVGQSFCYRPRPRRHLSRALDDEEAGLLSADALSPRPPGDSAVMNRGRTSRTRGSV